MPEKKLIERRSRQSSRSHSRGHANASNGESRGATIGETIYDVLKHDIVYGVLPPGQFLDELALVQRFDSSRTPIREALARLSGDGLVVQHRNRGVFVAEIRVSELSAFLEALHLMQRVVTRLAAQRWTDSDLDALRKAAEEYEQSSVQTDPVRRLQMDQAFHHKIAEIARNEHLEGLYKRLLDFQMRILLIHAQARNWNDADLLGQLDHSVLEHFEMLEAISSRDADVAERLAGEHIRLIRKRVLAMTSSEIPISLG